MKVSQSSVPEGSLCRVAAMRGAMCHNRSSSRERKETVKSVVRILQSPPPSEQKTHELIIHDRRCRRQTDSQFMQKFSVFGPDIWLRTGVAAATHKPCPQIIQHDPLNHYKNYRSRQNDELREPFVPQKRESTGRNRIQACQNDSAVKK